MNTINKVPALMFALLTAGMISAASAADTPVMPEGSTPTQGGPQPDTPSNPQQDVNQRHKFLHQAPTAESATTPPPPLTPGLPPPNSAAPWPNAAPPQTGLGGTPPPASPSN